MRYQEALQRWLNDGGMLYEEWNFATNKNEYYTTDDNGEIKELYEGRAEEYKDLDLEEYIKLVAKRAMKCAGESEENMEKYLDY